MCGISGFAGDFSQDDLHKMNDLMVHRGPDDSGVFYNGRVGFAHRRLSIIDVEGGRQPVSNEDNTIWLVYNGEIYNFQFLRERYLSGHSFKTRSDSEVIIHLYEEFGEGCVDYLRGMFAFAIWDENKQKMFLARDRFGIKPLYYAQTRKGFVFASELKAILAVNLFDREIDKEALDLYLTFRYVPGSLTMFKGIRKLEPAHYAVVQNDMVSVRQYWDLDFREKTHGIEEDFRHGLTELLDDSINLRLISEVPLGAFLSGGLDSSYMVGLMSQLVDEPVKTFTAGFSEGWHDESSFARIVADRFGTDHHLLIPDSDVVDVFKKVVWHLDEPLGDAATIPTYLLSQLTREHVTVILSGEGADELLAGYDKYKILYYWDKVSSLSCPSLFRLLSKLFGSRINFQRGFNLFASGEQVAKAYLELVSVFSPGEKVELSGRRMGRCDDNADAPLRLIAGYLEPQEESGDLLDRLMYLDIKTWLPNDVLLKNDKMTMAHSLEARVPFLDHKLAEYLVRMPSRFKLKGLSEKYILRKAMTGLIPEKIVKRRKHGFTVPVGRWVEDGKLKGLLDELFARDRINDIGLWDYASVERLMSQDLNNEFYRRQFWTLLSFELWHKLYME